MSCGNNVWQQRNAACCCCCCCQLPARVAWANCLCNKSVESSVHAVQRATLHPLSLLLLPHSTLDSSNCPLISDKRRHNLILPRAYLHFDSDSCRRCRRLFLCLCPCLCRCHCFCLGPLPSGLRHHRQGINAIGPRSTLAKLIRETCRNLQIAAGSAAVDSAATATALPGPTAASNPFWTGKFVYH